MVAELLEPLVQASERELRIAIIISFPSAVPF